MTKKQITNKTILWFKEVCRGIRQEYAQGASYRKLEVDVVYLEKLLNMLSKNSTYKLKKYIDEKLNNIKKYHDPSSWNYVDISKMEGEDAYIRGVFEALETIKNLFNLKKL